jgi:hypothetical protein
MRRSFSYLENFGSERRNRELDQVAKRHFEANRIKKILKYTYCEENLLGKGTSSMVYSGINTETSNIHIILR